MLKRKIENYIREHLQNDEKILLIDGARQIGKTYIIRYVCKEMFTNYIEIDMLEDFLGEKNFENVRTINDFYLQLSMKYGNLLDKKENTIVFIDEIQTYSQLFTLLKFLKKDNKYTYIASGSLLGVSLADTLSIPIGSLTVKRMYPLDFEEFLYANGFNEEAINFLKNKFLNLESLDISMHNKVLDLFKKYLIVGGLPDAVNNFIENLNIMKLREIQNEIYLYYKMDAAKYSDDKNLKIKRIFEMIPSNLENKKKRIIYGI